MTTQLTPLVTSEIAIFAERYSVPVEQAYTLPAIFNKMAEIGKQPVRSVVNQAIYRNPELAEYVKELSAKVANEDQRELSKGHYGLVDGKEYRKNR